MTKKFFFSFQACWNLGVYVFQEIRDSGVYGVPRDLEMDGMFGNRTLCKTRSQDGQTIPRCKPMKKVYFKQYQYVHYFLLLFAFLYWAPYWVFEYVEADVIRLRKLLEKLPMSPKIPDVDQFHSCENQPFVDFLEEKSQEDGDETKNASSDVTDDETVFIEEAKTRTEKKFERYLAKVQHLETLVYKKKLEAAACKAMKTIFIDENKRHFRTFHIQRCFHDNLREPIRITFPLFYAFLNIIPLLTIDYIYHGKLIPFVVNYTKKLQIGRTLRVSYKSTHYRSQNFCFSISMGENGHSIRISISSFFCMHINSLSGHFIFHGFNWAQFSWLNIPWIDASYVKYPYLGNVFLPTIAFCDLRSIVGEAREIVGTTKLVCEVDSKFNFV